MSLTISAIHTGWQNGDLMDAYHKNSQILMIQVYGQGKHRMYGVLLRNANFNKLFQWIVVKPSTKFTIGDDNAYWMDAQETA